MNRELIEKNQIMKLTFEFALDTIEYCEELEGKRKFVLANQLLKSATSIGANVWEAQNAESKNDFIHKFKIAKESEEANYWLLLCKSSKNYTECSGLLNKLECISKNHQQIIATSKNNKK
jgi:four helix bundle protein